MAHTSERLACRCCGIKSPDVGFTYEPEGGSADVLCDDCATRLDKQIATAVWRGFLRDRACFSGSAEERATARHLYGSLY